MRSSLLIVLPVALIGCATPGSEMAEGERRWQAQRAAEERCASFGHEMWSPAHSACMERLYVEGQRNRAAIGAALIGSGALNRPAYQPMPVYQVPVPRTTTCSTTPLGFTSCTTR